MIRTRTMHRWTCLPNATQPRGGRRGSPAEAAAGPTAAPPVKGRCCKALEDSARACCGRSSCPPAGVQLHLQRWQREQLAPSLHPRAFPAYLHANAQNSGWPAEPRDGNTAASSSKSAAAEAASASASQACWSLTTSSSVSLGCSSSWPSTVRLGLPRRPRRPRRVVLRALGSPASADASAQSSRPPTAPAGSGPSCRGGGGPSTAAMAGGAFATGTASKACRVAAAFGFALGLGWPEAEELQLPANGCCTQTVGTDPQTGT